MIDMSKLQVGDIVHFRSGGSAIVDSVRSTITGSVINFTNYGAGNYTFDSDGSWNSNNRQLLDIVKITPKSFDWSIAERGMAFRYRDMPNSPTLFFIGLSSLRDGTAIFETDNDTIVTCPCKAVVPLDIPE